MRATIFLTMVVYLLTGLAHSQERPYPQNIKYPYGFMPKGITTQKLKTEYDRWKTKTLVACDGGVRLDCVGDGAGQTLVEGMGFAMLYTALMGDKTEFDGLLKFYKSKLASGKMMGWKVTCSGISDQGSASDGDVDVAFSLIIASWQWPSATYLTEAKTVITNLEAVIKTCGGISVLAPGMSGNSSYGNCEYTDLSYYNPAAFRLFAEVSGNSAWTTLADDTYTILNKGANSSTGLIPDWQNPTTGQAGAGGREATYRYDACRAPWRIALDYLWNGNKEALAWCKKVSDWAYKIGPKNIKDGYQLSGSATGSTHNMCFTGGFACAAMCNSQEMADAFATELSAIASRDNTWFTFSVGIGNMITLTGNQWRKDLITKKDSTRTAEPVSHVSHSPKINFIQKGTVFITGLQPGYSVKLTTLSGKLLYSRVAEDQKLSIDISSIKSGCRVCTIFDNAGTVREQQVISNF